MTAQVIVLKGRSSSGKTGIACSSPSCSELSPTRVKSPAVPLEREASGRPSLLRGDHPGVTPDRLHLPRGDHSSTPTATIRLTQQ